MANIATFTAAFKRDGQDVRLIPNCATYQGFLCRVSGRKLQPIWDAEAISAAGLSREQFHGIPTVEAALKADIQQFLLKFGKHTGYWVWNHEAAERKKLEAGRTVYLYEKKQEDWDDDEPELRMSDKPYPAFVWEAIRPHIRKDRSGYEITNYRALVQALSALGWKTNRS